MRISVNMTKYEERCDAIAKPLAGCGAICPDGVGGRASRSAEAPGSAIAGDAMRFVRILAALVGFAG